MDEPSLIAEQLAAWMTALGTVDVRVRCNSSDALMAMRDRIMRHPGIETTQIKTRTIQTTNGKLWFSLKHIGAPFGEYAIELLTVKHDAEI